MNSTSKFRYARLTALCAALGFASLACAQTTTVTTVPVGAVTVTIAAGTGTAFTTSYISAPLLADPLVPGSGSLPVTPTGIMTGAISSVTSGSVICTNAGWSINQLALTGYPMFVLITSGVNQGRAFYITSNTADTLTLNTEGYDLSTLTFATGTNGDTYKIIAGETLRSLCGTPLDGVVGGTSTQFSAGQVDKATFTDINKNTLTYYYNTTNSKWQRSGSTSDQGNAVISPLCGIMYQRIGSTSLTTTYVGTVPSMKLKSVVPATGTTFLARYFPTDTTLAQIGIQNIAGWRTVGLNGVTYTTADKVSIKYGSTVFSYYYDSSTSTWKRSGSSSNQGITPVAAGSSIMIQRFGTIGNMSVCQQDANYAL